MSATALGVLAVGGDVSMRIFASADRERVGDQRVTVSGAVASAGAALGGLPHDRVVSDFESGGKGGHDLLGYVQGLPELTRVRMIPTAISLSAQLALGIERGDADTCLPQPFSLPALRQDIVQAPAATPDWGTSVGSPRHDVSRQA